MDILLVGTYTQHDAPAVLEKQELGKGIYLIRIMRPWEVLQELLLSYKCRILPGFVW